mmetsp:Transcript_22265/g.33331  ORF Transcript_22265/g.33331 Transcript_22265/m.33331 type:complete len:345 (+) Transcript_22265:63-1097(+)
MNTLTDSLRMSGLGLGSITGMSRDGNDGPGQLEEEISMSRASSMVAPSVASSRATLANSNLSKNATAGSGMVPIQRQVRAWYRGICIRQTCHSDFANKYQKADKLVNALTVTLTAITSSVIFTSISPGSTSEGYGSSLATIAGILAAINAVIQSLHKALGLAEAGERHTQTYKQFTSMRFRLERLSCGNFEENGTITVNEEKLAEWASDYGKVLESAPLIPQSKFDAVRQKEKEKEHRYFNHTDINGDADGTTYRTSNAGRRFRFSLKPLARTPLYDELDNPKPQRQSQASERVRSDLRIETTKKSVHFEEEDEDEEEDRFSVVERGFVGKTSLAGGSMKDFQS